MAATGLGFAAFGALPSPFWPLAVVAFVGTLNPSSGDVSLFLPIEHAQLAHAAHDNATRTALFARYSLTGSLCAAVGALASGLPALAVAHAGWPLLAAPPEASAAPAPLSASRAVVVKLAALFCVDSFAGGLLVNALLALWLFRRFGLSLTAAGQFFFWAGLLTTASQLLAPVLARRIGLLNTMVFTHIPASVCLIGAALAPSLGLALALLLARAACSSMDVPARSAYVMAVVTPAERAAAASFTAVPRSLASALGPSIGGALLASGLLAAPLVLCGGLKIAYDLALLYTFRNLKIE
jgi:predicted MFS family arabinose efflux permease